MEATPSGMKACCPARPFLLVYKISNDQSSPWFVRKMRASLADLIKERGRLPHGSVAGMHPAHTFSDEFVPDLVSAMFVEAITWWLEHEQPYTPREIATRAALLASVLFKEASTWQ